MTEEKLNALRQQDMNLRDAIRQDEMERPQMPADLNARLMQRMATQEEKKPRRIVIWPWIAAACVAGVMIIWLTPPKDHRDGSDDPIFIENGITQNRPHDPFGKGVVSTEVSKVEEPVVAKVETKTASQRIPRAKKVRDTQNKLMTSTPQVTEVCNDLAEVQEKEVSTPLPSGEGHGVGAAVTLTERDIPVTRPENYKYTPEEIALMKKQANEAYLKWVELELEISKNNLQQTAQQ